MSNNVASAGGSTSGSASGSGLFVYDERRDTYDLNTRILATAVICLGCVVVLMIFLHLYFRQALLGRHHAGHHRTPAAPSHLLRFYMSDPVGHDDPAGHVGLDPAAISALPTQPYRAHADGGEPSECAVCLGAVEEEEVVRVMPGCKHTFHVGCIDVWLGSHSTCPVCRTGVEPPPAVTEAAAPPAQEGTSSGSKEPGSASSRFGSFRRMLSWERSSTGRRAQGEGMEDLERQ